MQSWFIILNIILLISPSYSHIHSRLNAKRRYPISSISVAVPADSIDDNSMYGSGDDSLTESSKISTARTTNQANEEQIEQFTRLLYDRLNIREPPNVTKNISDGTGIPLSIVKQFEQQVEEQQRKHHNEENKLYQLQKTHEDTQSKIERAILPGVSISSYTCQRQLAASLNLNQESLTSIDCFQFSKSSIELRSLPANQLIKQLRIYVRKDYFTFHDQYEHNLTPDMFHIYQVFRPTSYEIAKNPFTNFSNTTRVQISHIKIMTDGWIELTVATNHDSIDIQQIYKQFITPFYGIAINRELRSSHSSFYRRYYSKKHLANVLRSYDEEGNNQETEQQLPYMLVDYDDSISSSGRRVARNTGRARPARACEPKNPCCRRPLIIDFDLAGTALNFVIYPRQIDIGECIGLCGISGSSLNHVKVKNDQHHKNDPNAGYNLFLLQYSNIHANKNTTIQTTKPDQQSVHCCSYSRTGGLDLMYTATNGGPIIRKFLPNIIVEDCKCGLPATIEQV